MSLPNVDDVRGRIDAVDREDVRLCLKCAYLFAARISELVSRASPKDNTVARGPLGSDYNIDVFELGPIKVEVAVFKVKTAKRGGRERKIALPLDGRYEKWTEELVDYYESCKNAPLFPFTRQRIGQLTRKVFGGLSYPIEQYVIVKKDLGLRKVVKQHIKPFRLHALRHLRATELVEFYGFDGMDLSVYGGWTLRSMIGVGSSLERYAHLQWQRYFPKLLKER
jgi:hypothetical protein